MQADHDSQGGMGSLFAPRKKYTHILTFPPCFPLITRVVGVLLNFRHCDLFELDTSGMEASTGLVAGFGDVREVKGDVASALNAGDCESERRRKRRGDLGVEE